MIVYEINPTLNLEADERIPGAESFKVFWTAKRDAMAAARDMIRECDDGLLLRVVVTRLQLKNLTPTKMALACLNLTSYLRNFAPEDAQDVLIDAKREWEWEWKEIG